MPTGRIILIAAMTLAASLTLRAAPPGQTVRGTLVAKTATTLDVRPEDEQQIRRFVLALPGSKLDPKFQAFLAGVAVGSEVEVTQTGDGMHYSTNVMVLGAPGKSGKVIGTVTGIINGRLEVEDSKGDRKQYVPRYVPGGDKEMGQAIAQRHVGDRVEIRFFTDDWTRVVTMRVLSISPAATTQPGFEGGTVVGKVVAKDKDSITIKPDEGNQERYLPQRIVGEKDGLDKDVLKAMAAAKVGDRLEARWFKDGERRLYSLKPAAAVKPPLTQPTSVGHESAQLGRDPGRVRNV